MRLGHTYLYTYILAYRQTDIRTYIHSICKLNIYVPTSCVHTYITNREQMNQTFCFTFKKFFVHFHAILL